MQIFASFVSVAHVTIVNEGTTWEEETKMYEIYYNETFKPILPKDPHIALETSPPKLISTPVESSMCGVEGLKVGAEYLISGKRSAVELKIFRICRSPRTQHCLCHDVFWNPPGRRR